MGWVISTPIMMVLRMTIIAQFIAEMRKNNMGDIQHIIRTTRALRICMSLLTAYMIATPCMIVRACGSVRV